MIKYIYFTLMGIAFFLAVGLSVSITTEIVKSRTRQEMFLDIFGESKDYMLTTEPTEETHLNRYGVFLDDGMASFIVECCESFDVDTNLVIAILEKENPLLIKDAVSKPNENGTVDTGLFQLNDRSLYSKGGFLDKYWDQSLGEFNSSNWKNNAYVAIRLIGDLEKMFGKGKTYWIACAYNAGPQRAYKEWTKDIGDTNIYLPESTRNNYAPAVVQNFKKWNEITQTLK